MANNPDMRGRKVVEIRTLNSGKMGNSYPQVDNKLSNRGHETRPERERGGSERTII